MMSAIGDERDLVLRVEPERRTAEPHGASCVDQARGLTYFILRKTVLECNTCFLTYFIH